MKMAGVTGIARPYRGVSGMRRAGFGSVWKHHYTRFPHMPATVAPPAYGTDGRAIGVFLIFDRFVDRPSTDIEDWLVKSAAWARRSWILNSDAMEQGVALKFYVEEQVRDRVDPLLVDYHVDISKDVIYFDGEPFKETMACHFNGRGGKQAAIFSDPQFRDYEWVFQIDADMFLARPPGVTGHYPFFERFLDKIVTDFAVIDLHGHRPISEMRWPVQKMNEFEGDECRKAWCEFASVLANKDVNLDSVFRGNSAAMTAFHANALWNGHLDVLGWMTHAGKRLQSDEGMFSLLMYMGEEVTGIMSLLGLSGVWGVEQLYQVRERGDFYLAHMGLPHEWDWRADIGVEDMV